MTREITSVYGGPEQPSLGQGTKEIRMPLTEVVDMRTVLARARELNATAKPLSETQASTGGANSLIPLIYGTQIVGGKIGALKVNAAGNLCALVVWCLGEVQAVVFPMINFLAVPTGVTVTNYTGGVGNVVDPTMQAAIGVGTYTDTLPGICYSVFQIPPGKTSGFPRFAASIQGRKIRQTSAGGRVYSDNPAYIIADFIEDTVYGMARTIDWNSVPAVANDCAIDLDATAAFDYKRILCLVMDQSLTGETWLQTLRDYAGCFVVPEGGSYRLVLDGVGSSVMTFNMSNIVSGSLRLNKRGTSDKPTMVEVEYTDTAYVPWRTARYTTDPVTPRRLSRISKPGILYYSQAKRYAIERLNDANLCDLTVTFTGFDECLKLMVGELITVSHDIGLVNKVFRVAQMNPVSAGRWQIVGIEYDAAKYSSVVTATPSTPDTSLPSPGDPPTLTAPTVSGDVVYTLAGGYNSRIRATWTPASNFPYVSGYEVKCYLDSGGTLIDSCIVQTSEYLSPPVALVAHRVSVAIISSVGVKGTAAVSAAITPSALPAVPANVASFTSNVATPGTVRLFWTANAETDVSAYEIRYGASWAAGTYLDRVAAPATRYETGILAAGAYTFWIKALNAVRNVTYPNGMESATESSVAGTIVAISTSNIGNGANYVNAAGAAAAAPVQTVNTQTGAVVLNGNHIAAPISDATKDIEVAKHLRWKYGGNNYAVIDVSMGVAPDSTVLTTEHGYGSYAGNPELAGWHGGADYWGLTVNYAKNAYNATNLNLFTIGQVLHEVTTNLSGNYDWNTSANYENEIRCVNGFTTGSGAANYPSAGYNYGISWSLFGDATQGRAQFYVSHVGNDLCFRGGWGAGSWQAWNRVWTDVNDGPSSGLAATEAKWQSPETFTTNWDTTFANTGAHRRGWVETSTGGPAGSWWFVENMRHSNASSTWGRQNAWGWEDNYNDLYSRRVSSGSWGQWARFWHSHCYIHTFLGIYTIPTTTGSYTVNFTNGQHQVVTLTGSWTPTFSFPGVGHYQVRIVGNQTVTFPTPSATFQYLNATAAPTHNTGTYGGVLNLHYDGTMTIASYSKIGAV